MTAALAGRTFGVLSLVAVGLATTAMIMGVLVYSGAGGLHGLNGASGGTGPSGSAGTGGANGANGVNGANGQNGVNGTNGANGANSTLATWGTLSLSFGLGGKSAGISLQGATCSAEGHGAYACLISLQNSGTTASKVVGLSYAPNPAVYYAGADPTLGSIVLNGGATTTFTLWFQAVTYSGSASVAITLIVEPGSTPTA